MYIYIIYILFSFLLYHIMLDGVNKHAFPRLYDKRRLYYVVCVGFLLILILSLKDVSVGTDTKNYYYLFMYDHGFPDYNAGNEAGKELAFQFLRYICYNLNLGWIGFSVVVSCLIVVPMCIFFYKYSENVWSAFFIYMTIGLFGMNVSGIRQSIAVSMVLLGIMYLYRNKYLVFIFFVFLGYLFHTSALFALSIIVVPFIKYRSKQQMTLLLALPLLARVFGFLLFGALSSYMYERYVDYLSADMAMNPILEIMWICILAFAYWTLMRSKEITQSDFIIYILLLLFVSSIELSNTVYMAVRLSFYFEIAVMVAIPNLLAKYKTRENRLLLSGMIYSLCLVSFVIQSFGSDTLSIFKYKFFWQ